MILLIFLLSRVDDEIIREGIRKLTSDSKSFDFLKEEIFTFSNHFT